MLSKVETGYLCCARYGLNGMPTSCRIRPIGFILQLIRANEPAYDLRRGSKRSIVYKLYSGALLGPAPSPPYVANFPPNFCPILADPPQGEQKLILSRMRNWQRKIAALSKVNLQNSTLLRDLSNHNLPNRHTPLISVPEDPRC